MSLSAAWSACSLKPVLAELPSEVLEAQPQPDACPESPSRATQPGMGWWPVGNLRMAVGTCLGVGKFSHTKFKSPFLRKKVDWNEPPTVLLLQASCQWLAH